MNQSKVRIALVAEEISSRPDEGALRFLAQLLEHLSARVSLRAFHTRGDGLGPSVRVRFSRFGVGAELASALLNFKPSVVLYVPSASLTPGALWRTRALGRAAGAEVAVLGLQSRPYGALARWWVQRLRPRRAILCSERDARRYRDWGWEVRTIALGVDLNRFRPLPASDRRRLRKELGWDGGVRVLLHVGHLRSGRGLDRLLEGPDDPSWRRVVVASTSTPVEEDLRASLAAAGVEIRREYDPAVERYYQAADAYFFPVRRSFAAIEFPLSVLEAMACDLPVLTTAHGGLPERFPDGPGLRYLEESEGLGSQLRRLMADPGHNRRRVQDFGWEPAFDQILEVLGEIQGARAQ